MLRINLLPAYVAQRRTVARLRVVAVLGLIVIIVVGVSYYLALLGPLANMTQQAQTAQNDKTQIDSLNSQANDIQAKVAPITNKVKFYDAVMKYNPETAQLYARVARWTSPAVYLDSMAAQNGTLAISGFTNSIADLGRYLQYMYTEPDVATVTLTSTLPSYSQAVVPVILYKGHPVYQPQQQQGQMGGPGAYGMGQMGGGNRFAPPGGFGPPQGRFGPPAGYGPNMGGGMGRFGANGGGMQNQAANQGPDITALAEEGRNGYTIGYRHVDRFGFEVQCQLKPDRVYTLPQPPSSGGGGQSAAGAAGATGAATTGAGAV